MFDKRLIPWAIVAVLVVLLIWSLGTDSGEPEVIEKHTTDTLTIVKTDTVHLTKVLTRVERVIDTTYITVNDTLLVPVPRKEYLFKADDLFDFRVKGYDVELLDVRVYPKTVYKTVTNTVEKEIYKNAWNSYLGVGIWAFNKEVVPTVNLMVKSPNRWLFGANIGWYNKQPIYGGSVNYKILGK